MEVSNSENLKFNKGDLAVGFDLTDTYSQISYGFPDSDADVETLSSVAGKENYMIPTLLFKRREVNQWFAGKDAVRNSEQDGIMVDRLLEKARTQDEIKVGDESFRPAALLALFMKRTLAMISIVAPVTKIASFMVTVDVLDDRTVSLLTEATSMLGLKTKNIFFQSHMESFYYYTIYQPEELWNRNVLLLDFTGECLNSYRMECNKNTTPIVAFIDPVTYTGFKTDIKEVAAESGEAQEKDRELKNLLTDLTDGKSFSSIYFIGENFDRDIYNESLRQLAGRGRLFEGSNLYSKGAAYAAQNKLVKTIFSENYVFLGNEKLKSNIGINVLRQGQNAYMALMDAGINWFEASNECDIILNQGNRLSFVITPLTGKNPEVVDITLNDLPKRPPKTTRLHVSVKMISENKMQVNVKDLGFGELFPAGNIEWNEVIGV